MFHLGFTNDDATFPKRLRLPDWDQDPSANENTTSMPTERGTLTHHSEDQNGYRSGSVSLENKGMFVTLHILCQCYRRQSNRPVKKWCLVAVNFLRQCPSTVLTGVTRRITIVRKFFLI